MKNILNQFSNFTPLKIILLVALSTLLIVWLIFTPPGILGKANAIGYAVCHQIPSHSFQIGERSLPLCARCTGMHLGALFGLIFHLFRGKRGLFPPFKLLIVFGLFLIAFGLDGINSYLTLLPPFDWIPDSYEPQNWLRLVTGVLLGTGIAAVIFPTFNQTIWKDWINEPALKTWKQLGTLILIAVGLIGLILTELPVILYPLAILSTLNVLLLLSMIYTILITMILKKENQYTSLNQLIMSIIGGIILALLQIAIMDYGRFYFTGTWEGFPL
ncbi:MAG: DUF2085 domain-containing protein [Anaerolineaceae bacterium]|nr:DUF2085 domain-containing protein [Anaerolineaceae bacterium]